MLLYKQLLLMTFGTTLVLTIFSFLYVSRAAAKDFIFWILTLVKILNFHLQNIRIVTVHLSESPSNTALF